MFRSVGVTDRFPGGDCNHQSQTGDYRQSETTPGEMVIECVTKMQQCKQEKLDLDRKWEKLCVAELYSGSVIPCPVPDFVPNAYFTTHLSI